MYKYNSLLILSLVIFINPGITEAEDWPTFMHDNQRSGVTSEQLQPPLSESWVFKSAHQPQPAWPGLSSEPNAAHQQNQGLRLRTGLYTRPD